MTTTYQVRPGTPYATTGFSTGTIVNDASLVSIVGSGAVLADDDDASYVECWSIDNGLGTLPRYSEGLIAAPLPAIPSAVLAASPAVSAQGRYSIAGSTWAPSVLGINQDPFWSGAGADMDNLITTEPGSSSIVEFDVPLLGGNPDDFTSPLVPAGSDASALLASGDAIFYFFKGFLVDSDVYNPETVRGLLYDVTLTFSYTSGGFSPLLRYPRADGRGLGPSRHVPGVALRHLGNF